MNRGILVQREVPDIEELKNSAEYVLLFFYILYKVNESLRMSSQGQETARKLS